MPQRLALLAATVTATIVLTVGLVAAGFGPAPQTGQAADAGPDEQTAASEAVPERSLEPRIVYIKPAPTPKTVVLRKQATPGTSRPTDSRAQPARAARQESQEREREDRDEDAREQRKKAAERAKERREDARENEREDDD